MNSLIVLQGPTGNYKKIIDCYRHCDKVVWATWDDEPLENKRAIVKAGIPLILVEKPRQTGFGNVNLQCKSTYYGILRAEHLYSFSNVIKIRADIIIHPLDKFLNTVEQKLRVVDMAFLGYHHHMGGYTLDYIVAGKKEAMKRYWLPVDSYFSGLPFAEMWLQQRYYGSHRLQWKSYYLDHPELIMNLEDIKLHSLKWNLDVSQYSEKQNYYMFHNFSKLALRK